MFKKQHVYGHILIYLYKYPDKRFNLTVIHNELKNVEIEYLKTVLNWLELDNLIVIDPILTNDKFYRLSYQGFSFIKELKYKRTSTYINSIAIIIAALGIIVASIISIGKGTQHIYIDNIKDLPPTMKK